MFAFLFVQTVVMYKIDIKEALYPIQIVLVVYKKFSKMSVFIDRKWPILYYIGIFTL